MMWSISGKRGIGKTYLLSKEVYKRSKQNYFIITNFSHVYSHIDCSLHNPEVLYEIIRQLGIFKERGYEICDLDPRFTHSGIFIAIDEAHLYFSSDLFKRYQSDDRFQYVLKFLAQARKSDVEIWYSAQDPAKIDKNWRRYTEVYVRYVPVIGFHYKKNILIQRPKRQDGTVPLPYFRREIRYLLPLLWEEHHKLDTENPVFDCTTVQTPEGDTVLSPHSTLQSRRLALSGWMDPFPYRLYDSYQMLAMMGDPEERDFKHLLEFGWVPHTLGPERFPTLKKIFGLVPNDKKMPPKIVVTNRKLPQAGRPFGFDNNVLKQPIEFLDDLAFFNQFHKPTLKRRFSWRNSTKGSTRKPEVVIPLSNTVLDADMEGLDIGMMPLP